MELALAPSITEALARGATLLTANQRAARSLRRAWDAEQRAQNHTLWTPPPIVALDTWLTSLWHQMLLDGSESRLLLNRSQLHSVWRGIIAADREVTGLQSLDALAELAADAWARLHLWEGRPRLREHAVTTDTRAFERWAMQFDRVCAREGFLTSAQLPAACEAALGNTDLPLPPDGVALIDFEPLPPAHAALFDSIARASYSVDRITTAQLPTAAHLGEFPDEPSEVRAAAAWAHNLFQEDPAVSIAIVVPDQAGRRATIERAFASTAPEFSLGRPLANLPPIRAALDLLRWPLEALPLEAVSALLLSPTFGAASGPASEEALAAAEFDIARLRRAPLLRPELSLTAFTDLVAHSPHATRLASLLSRLRALHRAANAERIGPARPGTQPTQLPHAAWADAFRLLLEAAGWTATAGASSLAFQTHRAWESALDELATLDFDGSRTSAASALAALARILRRAIFAPQSHNAPIQVIGPLELGAVPFDALWFLGADDLAWPSPPSAHPLLPRTLQRSLGMPGADQARDTARAQALTDRIAHSAAQVVFSYAQHTADGERRPSPLLRTLALAPLPEPAPTAPRQIQPLLSVADDAPLPPLPAGKTPGGSRVLQLQAACGFQAFAELRLRASEPQPRDPGFDPAERGQLVHRIMQRFWAQIESHDNLVGLSSAERDGLLADCIAEAVQRAARTLETPWDDAYVHVQRRRLAAVLRPWLDFERLRPAFTVEQREAESADAHVGPLLLDLRVDRVDLISFQDGGPDRALILDYKTGAAKPSDWATDRPDAPQLPLYAILADPATLGGVAFALLRPGDELALKGIAESEDVLPKSRHKFPTFADQVDDWRRVLTQLAHAFADGDVAPNPKLYPGTCERCAHRILCRLDPATLVGLSDDETQEESRG